MSQLLLKHVVLNGAITDVLIDNGKFVQIGSDIPSTAEKVINGNGHLAICPAFYNTHTHSAMTLLRGYADDLELFTWLNDYIWPAEAKLTFEDVYAGAKLAVLEMIKGGSVFLNDSYWHPWAMAQAAMEMGIRAEVGLLSLSGVAMEDVKQEQNEQLWDNRKQLPDWVCISCAPHAIYTVHEKRLLEIGEFARQENLRIHIHAAETAKEFNDCLDAHGKTPIGYLHQLGLLSPQTILAHCVHLTDDDRSLIAETGAVISHMPVSNQKLCSGIFDFTAALDAGCKVTIGTDGCSSNNNLSMFDEMKCAALSAKVKTGNPTCGKDVDIYRAATISGADAFNINAGEIAVGKEADAILIELDHPQMVGDYNLISNMVYSADTSVVDTTICRGNVLMEHRVVAGESEIISAARAVCRKLSGR